MTKTDEIWEDLKKRSNTDPLLRAMFTWADLFPHLSRDEIAVAMVHSLMKGIEEYRKTVSKLVEECHNLAMDNMKLKERIEELLTDHTADWERN